MGRRGLITVYVVHCSVRESIRVMDPWPAGSGWAQSTPHRPFYPMMMVAEEDQVPRAVVQTSTQYSVSGSGTRLTLSAERHHTPPASREL